MWSIAIEAFKCQLIGCKTMKTKLIYVEAWRETEPSCISFQNCLSSSFLIYPYTAWMKQLLKFFDLTYIYLCIFIHTAKVKTNSSQILCLKKVVIAHVCTLHIVCFCAESIKAWHCFINAVSDYNPLSASQINTIVGY